MFGKAAVHSSLAAADCHIFCSEKTASTTQNDLTPPGAAAHEETEEDHRQAKIHNKIKAIQLRLLGWYHSRNPRAVISSQQPA